jgi:hypothetical protein
MPRAIVIGILVAALAAATWSVLAQSGGVPRPRFSLSGGGGLSSGDQFTLYGFISRPDAGQRLAGETFSLQGGFVAGAANPRPRVCGDQNNDGTVNVFDAVIDLQIIAGLIVPTETQKVLGDVVRDGEINILDVNYTLRYIVGQVRRISGCGLTAPQVQVMEVPNLVITGDDPILQGGRLDPEVVLGGFPPTPPEFIDRGAHDLFEETEWTFIEETELGPGQTQETSVSIAVPALLQARATWFGALVPMEMEVSLDGALLATGTAHTSPPNRGTIAADVQIGSPGSATVKVVNNGSVPVGVQMIIGVLSLSLRP